MVYLARILLVVAENCLSTETPSCFFNTVGEQFSYMFAEEDSSSFGDSPPLPARGSKFRFLESSVGLAHDEAVTAVVHHSLAVLSSKFTRSNKPCSFPP